MSVFVFLMTSLLCRAMEHTSTITQPSMRGSGARTKEVAGEGCTMRVEKSMKESGRRIRTMDMASFDWVVELCFGIF